MRCARYLVDGVVDVPAERLRTAVLPFERDAVPARRADAPTYAARLRAAG